MYVGMCLFIRGRAHLVRVERDVERRAGGRDERRAAPHGGDCAVDRLHIHTYTHTGAHIHMVVTEPSIACAAVCVPSGGGLASRVHAHVHVHAHLQVPFSM